jgi:hypothetical protein
MYFNINFIGERSQKNSPLKSKNRSRMAVKKEKFKKTSKEKSKNALRRKKIVP